MKIAIVGSRDYPILGLVRLFVNGLPADTVVVTGGARGVDQEAERLARMRGLEVEVHKADWATLGRGAGMVRNVKIVNAADRVVAFWDGESRGTAHSMRLAKKTGKPLTVFGPDGKTQ